MAYSKVSLICGLLTFLVISNGVSARWLDDLVAQIKMEDIREEEHPSVQPQKPAVEMVNSHAPAPAPEVSIYRLYEAGKVYGFDETNSMGGDGAENDHDEDQNDSNIDSDSTFKPNGTDDDDNETDNSDDGPLP